jgi:hypothetical protein
VCSGSKCRKPSSAQFLAGLVAAMDPPHGAETDQALFWETFAMVSKYRGGQKKSQEGALKVLLDFQKDFQNFVL